MIELGRYLGTSVVAEGVERREELAFLRSEGCRTAQGYLFGPPARIDRFGDLTGLVEQQPGTEEPPRAARASA